ncbi:MAG: hypothetical protein Q8K69_01250 [Bacteroidota bacterium]|nr:hypothetical protein [Bacteroidota bacterium]MDP3444758.1 hypothetical protein [Ignavibacteria bacterium]
MTKKEKKEILGRLIGNLYSTVDIEEIVKIRMKIIEEVYSSGFNENQLKTISLALDTFGRDIDNNLISKLEGQKNNEVKGFTSLSIIGLLTLIDLSKLED